MNNKSTEKATLCSSSKSIRVSSQTKQLIDKKLTLLNKTKDCGKVSYDEMICLLTKEITKNQIERLQASTITWKIEEPRLMTLWGKKKGKITEEKWKQMLYTGKLQEFIQEHSRILA